jgi:3-mercaptopyruvate sulfurtransferase SseA
MMRHAGITNARALVGGWDEWVKRGGKVSKGEKP